MNYLTKKVSIKQVLITGATGRTGSLVFRKLPPRQDEFSVLGFAHSPEKVKQLFGTAERVRKKA